MFKMANSSEYHADFSLIAGFDDRLILDRPAGLDDSVNAKFFGKLNRIGFWKKTVGSKHGPAGAAPGFFESRLAGIDAGRLTHPKPKGDTIFRNHDRIGLHIAAHLERE